MGLYILAKMPYFVAARTTRLISTTRVDNHNPDPLVRLIGPANEAIIIVEGQEFPALINSRAQLLTMSEALVQALKLPVHNLHTRD